MILAKPQGSARYRFVDAGWLQVSTLGPLHLVFSRKGSVQKSLGLVTDDPELSAAGLIQTYETRWAVEVCQTQPIKMPRCPLRLFRQPRSNLRGGFKREHVMDVNRFSRDDDFADEALGDSLTFFTRELFKVMVQSLAKGLGIVNHLLPMNALLPSLSLWPTFLLNLWPLGSEFLTLHVQLTQVEHLSLIGIEHTLVLTLDPLLALEQGQELRLKR